MEFVRGEANSTDDETFNDAGLSLTFHLRKTQASAGSDENGDRSTHSNCSNLFG